MSAPLHLIQSAAGLERCLARAMPKAPLMLMGDAVYCAVSPHSRPFQVLAEDLAARGLSPKDLAPGVTAIDMKAFVALTVAHSPIIGWP